MKKILTQTQIDEAIYLRQQGKTKRELALLYGVGKTTIWENIFSKVKRKRIHIYIPKKPDTRKTCPICEIKLTREIKYPQYIPLNYEVEDKCITCYLDEKGLKYKDLYVRHNN